MGLLFPPQRPHLRKSLNRVLLILGTNQALAQHPRDTLLHAQATTPELLVGGKEVLPEAILTVGLGGNAWECVEAWDWM